MPTILKHKKYVFVSSNINSNKCWEIKLYDNGDVETLWGRIGEGKMQSKTFSGVGESFMLKKIKEKTRPSDHYDGGCYKEIETLDTGTAVDIKVASKNQLKEIAKKQIASCAVTSKLVEYFTEVNAHQISNATGGKITYDMSAGTFRTAIGIVTKKNVDEARDLLTKLALNVENSKFNTEFNKTLDQYLMLIPQDTGRKYVPKEFLGNQEEVRKQNDLLDGLESSYASVIASAQNGDNKVDEPKLFNVKMSLLDDKTEFNRISSLFMKTRKDMHYNVNNMKLKQVFIVDIQHMKEGFEKIGQKMTNIWELWHGTSSANILSILKAGFIIPPATSSYVCGRAFSHGVYFSDQSTKSLNYTTSYWGGKDCGRHFMFLNDVAMGNYFVPKSTTSSPPPKGYDSYFAKAGVSGVMNNEMIVFKIPQINPKFLCEFS